MFKIEPKLERDEALKARVLEALKTRYEEERVGIHATDLLWPRQAVFRKLQGSEVSERDAVFFALGAGEGEVAEELVGRMREVVVVHNGVIHTIDSVVVEHGRLIPVEIKTTRASPPSVKNHYLLQLGMYCAAMHVNRGKLVILYLNDGLIEAYNASYSREALAKIDEFELEKRREIEQALQLNDPMKASCVAGDPDLDWKCLTCQYWQRCSGEHVSFKIEFQQPLIPGRIYETALLNEALRAGEMGCTVNVLRNQLGEVVGIEASGDVVKLVPLRRTAEKIKSRLEYVNAYKPEMDVHKKDKPDLI